VIWTTKRLEEVADLSLGKMLDQEKNRGELLPYLANVNVRWGEFDLENLRSMRFEDNEFGRFSLNVGDIVMCEGGEPGRCAIWRDQRPDMMYQKALHRIRTHKSLDSSYLFYYFLNLGASEGFAPFFTGAAIKHLPKEQLAKVEIRYPDLPTQRQIASVLSGYDDLIETNRRRIALLEESARLIYREWFVKLRFPGHEQVKKVDGVPEGWERKPFSQLVDANPKTPFEKDRSYPFVPMQAISETSMTIGEHEQRVITGGAKFQNGDTLLARITPCLENGKTGFVQFLPENTPAASGSTEFIVLRSKSVNPYWVYCLAREDSFREHAIRSMAGADGRQRVNPKCFDHYMTLQPPNSILEAFEQAMQPVFAQVEQLNEQNRVLQQARDALLPKLMSGQLSV
jgi:type I restriction enzyme S subunit